jgi:hypothetical protein
VVTGLLTIQPEERITCRNVLTMPLFQDATTMMIVQPNQSVRPPAGNSLPVPAAQLAQPAQSDRQMAVASLGSGALPIKKDKDLRREALQQAYSHNVIQGGSNAMQGCG